MAFGPIAMRGMKTHSAGGNDDLRFMDDEIR